MTVKIRDIEIKINRLGAITNSTVRINRLMIFSGESGLGKSYLAVLCNYIFQVMLSTKRIDRFFLERGYSFNELRKGLKNSGMALSFTKSDFLSWLSKDAVAYLAYIFGNKDLQAEIAIDLPIEKNINIEYSEELEGLVDSEEAYLRLTVNKSLSYRTKNEDETLDRESPFSFLFRFYLVQKIFGDFRSLSYNFILPPSRGAIMTEEVIARTGLFQEFMSMMSSLKTASPIEEKANGHLMEMLQSILDGKVYDDKSSGSYFYKTYHADPMPISAAASSIKEIAPLALFVSKYNVSEASMLIEEPEAHLQALKQRRMADVLTALIANGCTLQITTHSDYLLRRINELIGLFNIKEKSDELFKKAAAEVNAPEYLLLNPADINAYLLRRRTDGSVEVVCENSKNGISYTSFHEALTQGLENDTKIQNYLEELRNAGDRTI